MFEEERTRSEPVWESVNSNLAGYDILSQVSATDKHQILIEVKSSALNMQDASCFISHKEWAFASAGYNQNRYYFYLWLIDDSPKIAIIPYSDMIRHIPLDNGLGEWSDVCVPFSAFKDSFQTAFEGRQIHI